MKVFPTVSALAQARIDEVLQLWEGLGYYSRARNLHKTAILIHQQGSFPSTYEQWLKMPGIFHILLPPFLQWYIKKMLQ